MKKFKGYENNIEWRGQIRDWKVIINGKEETNK